MALSKNAQTVKAALLKGYADMVRGIEDKFINQSVSFALDGVLNSDYLTSKDVERYAKEAAELIEAAKKG